MSRILRFFHPKRREDTNKPFEPPDLWTRAFETFEEREKDLATAYGNFLATVSGNSDVGGSLNSRLAWSVVKQLQDQRESKKWTVSPRRTNVNVEAKLEELAKTLLWSDSIINRAVDTQPFRALAWLGILIFLLLFTGITARQEAILEAYISVLQVQRYWKIWEENNAQRLSKMCANHLAAVVELYSHIAEYQARSICFLSKPNTRETANWDGWTEKADQVKSLSTKCAEHMSVQQQNEMRLRYEQQWNERCDQSEFKHDVSVFLEDLGYGAVSSTPGFGSLEDISTILWNKAYDSIKINDIAVVIRFESVLTQEIIEDDDKRDIVGRSKLSDNIFDDREFIEPSRLSLMKQASEKSVKKAQKHESVKNGVLTVSNFVLDLQMVGSAVLSSQPAAAMAWSGICVVIPLLTRPLVQEQAMLLGLSHVVSRMSWYMALCRHVVGDVCQRSSQLSKLKSNLENKIVQVYAAMLRYQMDTVSFCYEKHQKTQIIRTMLGSNDWDSRTMKLKELETELEQDIRQYSSRQSNDIMSNIAHKLTQQFSHTNQSEMATLLGLFKTTPYEQYMKANPRWVPGTCEWLRKHDQFSHWTRKENGILLISADAGCGKSVLARYLVQDVLPFGSSPTTVAYFFFRDNPNQRSLTNALCAIIHQIFHQHPELIDYCREEIQAHGPTLWSEASSLWAIFKRALSFPEPRQVICVLDALDACDNSALHAFVRLLGELWAFQDAGTLSIKFLVTTRGIPHILEKIQSAGSTSVITIREELTTKEKSFKVEIDLWKEVERVLEHRLGVLTAEKSLSWDTQEFLSRALAEPSSAPRTYLWMSHTLDALHQNTEDTPETWAVIAQQSPTTLSKTYEEMLQHIAEPDASLTRRLFHLIIAASQPLTVHEMNVAFHILGRQGAYSEKDLGLPPDARFRRWMTSTCGFFVTEFGGKIYFSHRGSEEFLLRTFNEADGKGSTWEGSITIQQAHRSLAESCVAYLSLGVFTTHEFTKLTAVFNKGLKEAQEKHWNDWYDWLHPDEFLDHAYGACQEFTKEFDLSSFSIYALQHWVRHFYSAQEFLDGVCVRDIDPSLDTAYFGLFDDSLPIKRPSLVMAAQVLEEDCGYRLTEFDVTTGIVRCHHSINQASLASVFGHHRLIERFLESDTSNFEELSRAEKTCNLLTESGPVIDPPSPRDQPALFVAAAGNWNSLSFLLKRPSHLNAKDQLARTPLHQAARLGRYKCLEYLADCFNLDEKDSYGWTALDYLINRINGIEDLDDARTALRKLIEARGEIIPSRGNRSPKQISLLSLAAKFTNETFLERRYSLRSLDGAERAGAIGRSRLVQVAYEGSLIKLLVDHGEDPNQSEPDCGDLTPLHIAAKDHFWNAVFLLRAGATVSPTDKNNRTPLHLACVWLSPVSVSIISLLLENGASANDADRDGITPFLLAILQPGELGDQATKIMLDYGADPHQRILSGCPLSDHRSDSEFCCGLNSVSYSASDFELCSESDPKSVPECGCQRSSWYGRSPWDIAKRSRTMTGRLESWLLDTSMLWQSR